MITESKSFQVDGGPIFKTVEEARVYELALFLNNLTERINTGSTEFYDPLTRAFKHPVLSNLIAKFLIENKHKISALLDSTVFPEPK